MWESNIQEGGQSLYLSLVLCVVEEVFMAVEEIVMPLIKVETLEVLMRIVVRRRDTWVAIVPKRIILLGSLRLRVTMLHTESHSS